MEKYSGIKINEEIILVEKFVDTTPFDNQDTPKIPQAYVVQTDNPKMLETALAWAKYTKYKKDEQGNYITSINERGRSTYEMEVIEGTQHRYKNGTFDFYIYDSANGSSQGGKLSFWTAKVVAPDNKEFLIGINSDILVEMLKHNTFIDGKCSSKVWLGRISGSRVGAFTETMPEFIQSKKDENFRKLKSTVKYQIGDIVSTKTSTWVYLGEQSEYFSKQSLYRPSTGRSLMDYELESYTLRVDNSPFKFHAYLCLDTMIKAGKDLTIESILEYAQNEPSYYFTYYSMDREPKKLSRIITGHIDGIDEKFYYKIYKTFLHKLIERYTDDTLKAHQNLKNYIIERKRVEEAFDEHQFKNSQSVKFYSDKIDQLTQIRFDYKIANLNEKFTAKDNITPDKIKSSLEANFKDFEVELPEDSNKDFVHLITSITTEEEYEKLIRDLHTKVNSTRNCCQLTHTLSAGREAIVIKRDE